MGVVEEGEAQAALIENQLLESLGAEEMERRRLVCNPEVSRAMSGHHVRPWSRPAMKNRPSTKAADERRFNVAPVAPVT